MADDWSDILTELNDGDEPRRPAPPTPVPGNVDVTSRLTDGTVLRVATSDEFACLTIAGPDGMATAKLTKDAANLLMDMLGAARKDLPGY